jgi:hypothetical protein
MMFITSCFGINSKVLFCFKRGPLLRALSFDEPGESDQRSEFVDNRLWKAGFVAMPLAWVVAFEG